jgi:glycosyltransferase involved in cell wall biosynthesis
MASAMLRLAQDPKLRARLGRAARQRAVTHYDTTKQVRKLEQVLLDAADSRPARASMPPR